MVLANLEVSSTTFKQKQLKTCWSHDLLKLRCLPWRLFLQQLLHEACDELLGLRWACVDFLAPAVKFKIIHGWGKETKKLERSHRECLALTRGINYGKQLLPDKKIFLELGGNTEPVLVYIWRGLFSNFQWHFLGLVFLSAFNLRRSHSLVQFCCWHGFEPWCA